MSAERAADVLRLIDLANAQDPNMTDDEGRQRPSELVYGERMSAALDAFCPSPSDHLRIAVRAQHIERWTSARSTYPDGRPGYLKWRTALKAFHARRAGELMMEAGYGQSDAGRVATLISKKGMKSDPEVQALEDVACLTFLEHYAGDFIAKHDDDKVLNILAKTANKMSPDGIAAAGKLPLPDRLATLLAKVLTGNGQT